MGLHGLHSGLNRDDWRLINPNQSINGSGGGSTESQYLSKSKYPDKYLL